MESILLAVVLYGFSIRLAVTEEVSSYSFYHNDAQMSGGMYPEEMMNLIEPAEMPPNTTAVMERQRRAVSFPAGTWVKMEVNLIMPLFSSGDLSGTAVGVAALQYNLPSGATTGRRMASDREDMYAAIERTLSQFGLHGKTCLLKTICDVAEHPFEDYGALGDVINTAMAASYQYQEDGMYDYVEAEYYGRYYGNCHEAYPCKFELSHIEEVMSDFVR